MQLRLQMPLCFLLYHSPWALPVLPNSFLTRRFVESQMQQCLHFHLMLCSQNLVIQADPEHSRACLRLLQQSALKEWNQPPGRLLILIWRNRFLVQSLCFTGDM